MKSLRTIIILAVALLLTACEKELEVRPVNASDMITITAIASPDTVVNVYVTQALDLSRATSIRQPDYFLYYLNTPYPWLDSSNRMNVITNAQVTLTVNGTQKHPMHLDDKVVDSRKKDTGIYYYVTDKTVWDTVPSNAYVADYTPKPGDELRIDVEVPGMTPATAVTTVLPSPKLEVLGMTRRQKPIPRYDYTFGSAEETSWVAHGMIDSASVVRLRITDPAAEHNYYRLVARSIQLFEGHDLQNPASGYNKYVRYASSFDIFESNDPIFHDVDLTKSWGSWPAYFSTVFDDRLFNGQSYEFVVELQMQSPRTFFYTKGEATQRRFFEFELQQISPELYSYLKSVERYRISDSDRYNDPVGIVSNVVGGWGCWGSSSSCHLHVEY